MNDTTCCALNTNLNATPEFRLTSTHRINRVAQMIHMAYSCETHFPNGQQLRFSDIEGIHVYRTEAIKGDKYVNHTKLQLRPERFEPTSHGFDLTVNLNECDDKKIFNLCRCNHQTCLHRTFRLVINFQNGMKKSTKAFRVFGKKRKPRVPKTDTTVKKKAHTKKPSNTVNHKKTTAATTAPVSTLGAFTKPLPVSPTDVNSDIWGPTPDFETFESLMSLQPSSQRGFTQNPNKRSQGLAMLNLGKTPSAEYVHLLHSTPGMHNTHGPDCDHTHENMKNNGPPSPRMHIRKRRYIPNAWSQASKAQQQSADHLQASNAPVFTKKMSAPRSVHALGHIPQEARCESHEHLRDHERQKAAIPSLDVCDDPTCSMVGEAQPTVEQPGNKMIPSILMSKLAINTSIPNINTNSMNGNHNMFGLPTLSPFPDGDSVFNQFL